MTKAVQFQIGGTLRWLEEDEPSLAAVYFTLRYEQFQIKAKGEAMAFTLPADKRVFVQVAYVDANGNPAVVDGPPTWVSSDEDIVIVLPGQEIDALKCEVRPAGKIGQAQVSVTADADLGEGTREIVTLMDITVIGGEAVAGTITPIGELQPLPEPK